MSYQIVENDVRLMRRGLVALQLGDELSAMTIFRYLRAKGLNMILPGEQTPEDLKRHLARLQEQELYLATKYGCVILPDYSDTIFLNSKWRNPYTLYVRLSKPEPGLGSPLGDLYWIPDALGGEEEFRPAAEADHERYIKREPFEVSKDIPWYKRIFK